jgi:membrane protease YdiL (CAAX protease family)
VAHGPTSEPSSTSLDPRRDPARDRRRLILFFTGLVACYAAALAVTHPALNDRTALQGGLTYGVMVAPTVGALLAVIFGPGRIQFGRPSWWILAGLLPVLWVLALTLVAAAFARVELHPDRVPGALLIAVPASLYGCIAATGEEIGWRGFLWPLLRVRRTFLASSAVLFVCWWIYHAPLTIAGWYGFIGGLPLFTVGLLGFVLFVGVLTDRSRSLWPSVLVHGSWNGLVATYFSATRAVEDGVFSGSRYLLGEFGALATVGMLLIGVGSAWWHQRHPMQLRDAGDVRPCPDNPFPTTMEV